MISVMSTGAPLGMPCGHEVGGAVPRAMFTRMISSVTKTPPLRSQSPTHGGVGDAVGGGVGVFVGVFVAIGVLVGDGVGVKPACRISIGVAHTSPHRAVKEAMGARHNVRVFSAPGDADYIHTMAR